MIAVIGEALIDLIVTPGRGEDGVAARPGDGGVAGGGGGEDGVAGGGGVAARLEGGDGGGAGDGRVAARPEGGDGGGARDGGVVARPGGGPYNTARTLGRLGMAPVFLDRLSGDSFGRTLRARLDADGVTLGVPEPSKAPTTLAVAEVDPDGVARYGFYLVGTSAADLDYETLADALPPGVTAVYVGALGLVMEPIGSGAERVILRDVPPDALVMVDPNCRPGAISDRAAYLARIGRILRRADVVKVSAEDLDYLSPGVPVRAAVAAMLDAGPALVLVTDGPRPARAFLPGQEITADIPQVQVVDTIGAGDAFGGTFLAWWSAAGLARPDLKRPGPVGEALRAAVEAAALTCARAGAEPPWGMPWAPSPFRASGRLFDCIFGCLVFRAYRGYRDEETSTELHRRPHHKTAKHQRAITTETAINGERWIFRPRMS